MSSESYFSKYENLSEIIIYLNVQILQKNMAHTYGVCVF